MKRLLICSLTALALMSSASVSAQYHDRFDRAGVFASLGVNNTNQFVTSERGVAKSLKGGMGIMPVIGGFYEIGLDKNFSMTFSGGLGYTNFSYTYTPEYSQIGKSMMNDTILVGVYPDGPGASVKRSYHTLMVLPQIDLNLMSNPIRGTAILEARLGLGAAIYLSKHKESFGDVFTASDAGGWHMDYYYIENVEMGKGNTWANTYSALYLGLRWRNTTSNFLNRSTLGIQAMLPFDNYRVGKSQTTYYAKDWDQVYQTETIKFKLGTIGLKYTFNFTPLHK